MYPEKTFEKINLKTLLIQIANNARVAESGRDVDILFAYTLENERLINCEPNNVFDFMETDGFLLETEVGIFRVRSFFADVGESCSEHFVNMLRMIDAFERVARIIMVADNALLQEELLDMDVENGKSLFLLRKYYNSHIEVPIRYVNIDNVIGFSLGLKNNEL